MAGTSFENLQVYRLSENLADEIWTTVSGWEYFSKATVGRQMVRAADSIGANIAEGTWTWKLPGQSSICADC